jgi:hypothetical protein
MSADSNTSCHGRKERGDNFPQIQNDCLNGAVAEVTSSKILYCQERAGSLPASPTLHDVTLSFWLNVLSLPCLDLSRFCQSLRYVTGDAFRAVAIVHWRARRLSPPEDNLMCVRVSDLEQKERNFLKRGRESRHIDAVLGWNCIYLDWKLFYYEHNLDPNGKEN